MLYKKLKRQLEGQNDKQLREFIKKTKQARKGIMENYSKLREKFWQMKEAKYQMESMQKMAREIRGERKGKNCPALVKTGYYYECKARDTWTNRRSVEGVYRDFCHSCRLTHEKAKTKAVLKGVFENDR